MYTSKYFTCEQIDQRLLQGYLDDYNSTNGTSLTKEEFLELIYNKLQGDGYISYMKVQSLTETQKARALSNLDIVKGKAEFIMNKLRIKGDNILNLGDLGFIGVNGEGDKVLIQSSDKTGATDGLPILIRSTNSDGVSISGNSDGKVNVKYGQVEIKGRGGENYVLAGFNGIDRLTLRSPSHIFSDSKRLRIISNVIRIEHPNNSLPHQDNKVVLPGDRVEIGSIFQFEDSKLFIGGSSSFSSYIGSTQGNRRDIKIRSHGLILENRHIQDSDPADATNALVLASYIGRGVSRLLGPMEVKTQHLIIDSTNNNKEGLQKTVLVNDRITLVAGPLGYKPTNDDYDTIVKESELGNSGTTRFAVTHENIQSQYKGFTWLEVSKTGVKISSHPDHPSRNNIELHQGSSQYIQFYQESGKFLFKYKDSNNQDIVLDLLAKIAELENRISELENK